MGTYEVQFSIPGLGWLKMTVGANNAMAAIASIRAMYTGKTVTIAGCRKIG